MYGDLERGVQNPMARGRSTMMKLFRTSGLSIKNSLSLWLRGSPQHVITHSKGVLRGVSAMGLGTGISSTLLESLYFVRNHSIKTFTKSIRPQEKPFLVNSLGVASSRERAHSLRVCNDANMATMHFPRWRLRASRT